MIRAGYYFVRTPSGSPDPSTEQTPTLETHLRVPLPYLMLLTDRNRFDFRFVDGDYQPRYRNRLKLERSFKVWRLEVNPYAYAEAFYDWEWHVWDIATHTIVQTLTPPDESSSYRIAWEQDSQGNDVPALKALPDARFGQIYGVSPDGQRLVSYPPEGDLSVFDAVTGDIQFSIEQPVMWDPYNYAFSLNGRLLAGAADQLRVELWDGETGIVLATLNIYGHAVAFSQDDLAVGSSWNVQLFPIADVLKATAIELPTGQE